MSMVVCVLVPRLRLIVAAGGVEGLTGKPMAIAPDAGSQLVGEVSGAAQAQGVRAGMAIGEALARCPGLLLVPADPVGVARVWEHVVSALEGIGAEVEPAAAGVAYFDARPLLGLYGDVYGVIASVRRAVARPVRIGVAPSCFCALAAASRARPRRARVIEAREASRYLASQPVDLLGLREQTASLVAVLQRLGIGTLGDLVRLSAAQVADRFGSAGVLARRLAVGQDEPLRPRTARESLSEALAVGQANSRLALERTLGVLVDRLLARPQRRGRSLRAVTLSARLVERGTWAEHVVLREAMSDRQRICLALTPRLALLPAPVEQLALSVERFGSPVAGQASLFEEAREQRLGRLDDAVRQVRAGAGEHAVLRAVLIDPRSRFPERRFIFSPWQ